MSLPRIGDRMGTIVYTGLPIEFEPIEYVDITKLFTHDSTITTNALDVELDAQFVYNDQEGTTSNLLQSTSYDSVFGVKRVSYVIPSYTWIGLRMINDSGNREYFPKGGTQPVDKVISATNSKIPEYKTRKQIHIHDCGYDMDGKFYQFEPSAIVNNVNWGKMRFGSASTNTQKNRWRIWRCIVRQDGAIIADFIPCIRLADNCPGLWCKVYNKFYEQPSIDS